MEYRKYMQDPEVQRVMNASNEEVRELIDEMQQQEKQQQGINLTVNVNTGEKSLNERLVETADPTKRDKLQEALASEGPQPNRLAKDKMDWLLSEPDISMLIDGKIHAAGIGQLFGPSYTGKTIICLDLGLSIAAGLKSCALGDLELTGMDVVYSAMEGGAAFRKYVRAWFAAHEEADVEETMSRFWVLDGAMNEGVMVGGEASAEFGIGRLEAEIAELGITPALVIYDTQIDTLAVDENNNTEAAEALRTLKRYHDAAGSFGLLIHHTGHDKTRARGASSFRGKLDMMVGLEPGNRGSVKVRWTDNENSKVKGFERPDADTVLRIETAHHMGQPVGGYVKRLDGLEAALAGRSAADDARDAQLSADRTSVLDAIREAYNSKSAIKTKTGLTRPRMDKAIDSLIDEGTIYDADSRDTRSEYRIRQ
ncbi:AAA family ATPase [Promicromonospora alba]|uniref:AAA family ATPase n=1 Tax=Promicromonospora alba TaxID=1616110 RepID=A0ABV9HQ65_9MICO